MSRKKKILNQRTSVKKRTPMESVGQGTVTPMTLSDCAKKLVGEEMRVVLLEILYSQIQMLEYISTTGLNSKSLQCLYQELHESGASIVNVSNEVLDYLRTLLIDGVEINRALEIADKLAALDASEDKEKVRAKVFEETRV